MLEWFREFSYREHIFFSLHLTQNSFFFLLISNSLATFLSHFKYQSIAFVELYTTQQSATLKNIWLPSFIVVNIVSIIEITKFVGTLFFLKKRAITFLERVLHRFFYGYFSLGTLILVFLLQKYFSSFYFISLF